MARLHRHCCAANQYEAAIQVHGTAGGESTRGERHCAEQVVSGNFARFADDDRDSFADNGICAGSSGFNQCHTGKHGNF